MYVSFFQCSQRLSEIRLHLCVTDTPRDHKSRQPAPNLHCIAQPRQNPGLGNYHTPENGSWGFYKNSLSQLRSRGQFSALSIIFRVPPFFYLSDEIDFAHDK
jgi:hypothetical protein